MGDRDTRENLKKKKTETVEEKKRDRLVFHHCDGQIGFRSVNCFRRTDQIIFSLFGLLLWLRFHFNIHFSKPINLYSNSKPFEDRILLHAIQFDSVLCVCNNKCIAIYALRLISIMFCVTVHVFSLFLLFF